MGIKRNDKAREEVKNRIIQAFGNDYICVQDKKIYVQAKDKDSGEICQFAISFTMPKTPVASEDKETSAPIVSTPTDLSPEDKIQIEKLMRKLGQI